MRNAACPRDLTRPRSASIRAAALAFIGSPRSACSVSWSGGTACFAMASWIEPLFAIGSGPMARGFELKGTFRVPDAPANNPAAIDVETDIEGEAGPFHRPHQFGVRRCKLSPGQFDPGDARPRLTPSTTPPVKPGAGSGWALRPAALAFDRPGGASACGVPQPRHRRQGSRSIVRIEHR